MDLVSPFGEVVAQKRTSDNKMEIPILPMWECGFYELRMYKDFTSPIISTRIIPIIGCLESDSIPVWESSVLPTTSYPDWFLKFISQEPQN